MTETFQVRHFDEYATKVFLEGAIRPTSSVPFLGTGFTAGERAREYCVPFGSEWLDIMRKQILKSTSEHKPQENELNTMGFQDVSDVYFSGDFVSLEDIKLTLDAYFSNVVIQNSSKKKFIDIAWPYIYTLNIDDGIERSIDAIKILPYRNFSKLPNRRHVYKLHGDIEALLTAASHKEMEAIFGRKHYVAALDKNKAMIADLINDFAEKNLLFVGCSLSDELDILYALARAELPANSGKGARIFVCKTAPQSFMDKKKMRDYGITDVIVVPDYSFFYCFIADAIEKNSDTKTLLLNYEYKEEVTQKSRNNLQIRYLIQAGWNRDSYDYSIKRQIETEIQRSINEWPLIAVWGRRFSGKTTLLYRILNEYKTRQRILIKSSTTVSDDLFNEIFRAKNNLIAIDSNALYPNQLRKIAENIYRIHENGTCIIITMGRTDLNYLNHDFNNKKCIFELNQKFHKIEQTAINKIISPLGYQKWIHDKSLLDNIFIIASSPITIAKIKDTSNLSTKVQALCDDWKNGNTGKLQFMILYYLTIRPHISSKTVRLLAKWNDMGYIGNSLLNDIPSTWQPFVETEPTDPSSRIAENSATQLVSNSFAWLRYVVRTISEKVGANDSAKIIADLFSAINGIDSNAYEFVLFDSLNAVYEPTQTLTDWRGVVIRQVYEHLGSTRSDDPDYWLQRAKSIYYISSDKDELRMAAAFCEKGILERSQNKTWSNAQLTKANIYGKLCSVSAYANDDDMLTALQSYETVITKSQLNPTYIDELLRKSKNGRHYLSQLCHAASSRPGLLKARETIRTLTLYIEQN